MFIKRSALALAIAMTAGMAVAHADEVYSVTATYDAFGGSANTSITVQNLSGQAETNVVITSDGFTESLGTIAAGASATYSFNEAQGPFLTSPGEKGISDTTNYQVSANFLGTTISSGLFSPVNNLTGGYVDFLGACFTVEVGCSLPDPLADVPLTGVVADGTTPVPLPPSIVLMLSGLAGLGIRGVRRVSQFKI
jgi:hypothetical protein